MAENEQKDETVFQSAFGSVKELYESLVAQLDRHIRLDWNEETGSEREGSLEQQKASIAGHLLSVGVLDSKIELRFAGGQDVTIRPRQTADVVLRYRRIDYSVWL